MIITSLFSHSPNPPNVRGLRFSNTTSWFALSDSLKRCSTYCLEAGTRCTIILVHGMAHCHHPRTQHQPNLQTSWIACPAGPVDLGACVRSHMACVTVYAVPGLHAIRASQQILLYGSAMDGTTLCPGNSSTNTTSFARQGLPRPQSAIIIGYFKVVDTLCNTCAS